MNKCFVFVIGIISLGLTSCQFSESIYINEDGSGKMEFSFDASEIMQMAGDKMTQKAGEKEIDSVFSFKTLLEEKKDSISTLPVEQQEKLKALESFSIHIVMSAKQQKMNIGIFSAFKNVSELQNAFSALNVVSDMQNGDAETKDDNNPFSAMLNGGNSKLSYSLKDGVFKRTIKIIDKEVQEQLTDSLGQAAMMFASSKYKLNYHFPRKVKSVSNENALFSEDRKSVTVEYDLMEYLSDPELTNLEIILED